jgi:hypothetical protein
MYVLLETQRYQYPSKSSERFKDELGKKKYASHRMYRIYSNLATYYIVMSEPNLAEFLLSLLAKLREKLDKSFPVKKVVI